jgi:hypothetical protein
MRIMFVFRFIALKLINKLNLSLTDHTDNTDYSYNKIVNTVSIN